MNWFNRLIYTAFHFNDHQFNYLDLRTLKSTGNWCLVSTNLKVDACYSPFNSFKFSFGISEILEFRLILARDVGGDTEMQAFSFPMSRLNSWQSSQEGKLTTWLPWSLAGQFNPAEGTGLSGQWNISPSPAKVIVKTFGQVLKGLHSI